MPGAPGDEAADVPPGAMTLARRLVVHGRVQGVGFRYAMVAAARDAGVVGWVRNRRDGCVEAHVQGESQAVDRMIAWARRGPRAARVTEVELVAVGEDRSLVDFEQRPSA